MKFLILFLFLFSITTLQTEAKERIVISGNFAIEHPLSYENKVIVIEKNSNILVNTGTEYAIYMKNSELFINGEILNPITIKSKKIDSEQNVFYLEDSKASIKNAIFENNSWCIHAHNSDILIENTQFVNNFGGIRFFNSKTSLKKNIFEKNDIAIRFLNSNKNDITLNIFFKNKIAIFIREGIEKNGITKNAFITNGYDFYSGFFQSYDLSLPNNYFYDTPSIFDRNNDKDLTAIINIYPILSKFPDWH